MSRWLARRCVGVLVLAACVLVGGCRADRGARTAAPVEQPGRASKAVDEAQLTPTQRAVTDPCATRLQDIGGMMLLYYSVRKQMPARLEDLRAMPGGESLQFECPVSSGRYQYFPDGLGAAGRAKRVILCDPTPVHDGARWCLFAVPPARGRALSVEVLPLPEEVFRTYTRDGGAGEQER